MRPAAVLLAIMALLLGASPSFAAPVLMVSIDGLRPGDVIEADSRGLKVANLKRFLTEGTYATGVKGVLPTVTYPSHTTLITGVSPARHGVVNNTTFDPEQINQNGWYWYASDIRVPTLWQAVRARGGTVANVHWPVSVGAKAITWNLPQYWRTGHADDTKILAELATPGLIPQLERMRGEAYAQGIVEDIAGDENRGRFAASLIALKQPYFVTVYLTALDHQQHLDGPDSPQARAVLERIDAVLGRLIAAERAAHPDAVIALVSDHGFEPIAHETNLFRAFIDAGLIKLDAAGKMSSWDAVPWNSGGSAAVMLARRDDPALVMAVRAVLQRLKAEPANGIAEIIEADQIAAMGGNPQASFYLNFQPDTAAGSFAGAAAPLTGPSHYKGTHGYFPAEVHLRSSFMLMGPGIPAGKSLGEIDMRAIAPTLARIMRVKFTSAEAPALAF